MAAAQFTRKDCVHENCEEPDSVRTARLEWSVSSFSESFWGDKIVVK